jgi:nuclear pore complex protein Nup98-Nup96
VKLVQNWSTQGQIVADFIGLNKEFEAITMATHEDHQVLELRLEALKLKLSDLCSVIKLFPCPTSKHRLCQSEISLKLLFLIRKFFTADPYVNSCALMRIALDKLPLPQEYAQQEQRHMLSAFLTEDFRIN